MRTRVICVAGIVLIWVAAFCWPVPAADDAIRLPMTPVLVEPDNTPVPSSEVISTLAADQWYVVESVGEVIALQSPEGIVDIESTSGPIKVRGMFVDGTGKIETRTYSSPYVYFVTAKTSGKTELILIPIGVTAQQDIVRQVLTVSGIGPQPPPGPGPEPQPEPEPTPQATNVSLAIVEDTMNRTPEMAITMNGIVGWTAFVDSGNDWRAYDLTTGEARGKKAITDLNGPSPGIVIYDKATGKMIHRGDMPATIDELKTLIGGLTGG
jgi:hypothetical protein